MTPHPPAPLQPPVDHGKLISNVQALRAFAALFVVVYHTHYTVAGVSSSYFGVELFFCISGFVMTHVSRTESPAAFLRARLVRIVPLYWIATVLFFLFTQLGLTNPTYVWPILWNYLWTNPAGLWLWVTSNVVMDAATWSKLLNSLFFIPYTNSAGGMQPLLGVGWTLNLEMFFYLLFAAAIAFHRQLAPVIVAVALLVVRVVLWDVGPPVNFYASAYLNFFIFGIACYYGWAGLSAADMSRHRGLARALACAAAAVYLWAGWRTQLPTAGASFVDGLLARGTPPLALFVALWCHSRGLRVRNAFLLELGAASYALYLFHLFVMETLRPVGAVWSWLATDTFSGMLVSVLLSVLLALAVHRLVERPLARLLKGRRALPKAKVRDVPEVGAATGAV